MVETWKRGRPRWKQEWGDIQFPYAYDTAGKRVEARTAPRQASYTCLACHQPMQLRRGKIRRAYFAHVERNIHCSPEKALHDLARAAIAEGWRAALAASTPYRVGWNCTCGQRMTGNLTVRSRAVEEGRTIGQTQPDLVGLDESGQPSVVVEVLVDQELALKVQRAYQQAGLSLLCIYPAWDDLEGLTEGLETVWVEAPLSACTHPAPQVAPPLPPAPLPRPQPRTPPRPDPAPTFTPYERQPSDPLPVRPTTPPVRPVPLPAPRQAPPPVGEAGPCPSCGGPRERVLLEAWVRELPCWGAGCGRPMTTLYAEEGEEPGLRLTTPADETREVLGREVARWFGLTVHPQVGQVEGERLRVTGCPFCLIGQGVHVAPFVTRATGGPAPTWQAWGWRCATCGGWVCQEVRHDGTVVPRAD